MMLRIGTLVLIDGKFYKVTVDPLYVITGETMGTVCGRCCFNSIKGTTSGLGRCWWKSISEDIDDGKFYDTEIDCGEMIGSKNIYMEATDEEIQEPDRRKVSISEKGEIRDLD